MYVCVMCFLLPYLHLNERINIDIIHMVKYLQSDLQISIVCSIAQHNGFRYKKFTNVIKVALQSNNQRKIFVQLIIFDK